MEGLQPNIVALNGDEVLAIGHDVGDIEVATSSAAKRRGKNLPRWARRCST